MFSNCAPLVLRVQVRIASDGGSTNPGTRTVVRGQNRPAREENQSLCSKGKGAGGTEYRRISAHRLNAINPGGVHRFGASWPTRVWRHQVVRAIVHNQLAVVLAAVLDSKRPDTGVVGQPVAEKFRCIVQPRVTLLLNQFRSVRDRLLDELHHVTLRLENVTRRIVALAEVGPEF